jgi:hypothetical protein
MAKGKKKPASVKKAISARKVSDSDPKKKLNHFFRSKRPVPVRTGPPVSNVYRLFMDSVYVVRKNWKVFGGIFLVYLLFSLILASPFGPGTNVADMKEQFSGANDGSPEQLDTSLTIFGILLSSFGGSQTEGGTAYQTIFLILVSLAVIWVLRQALAEKKVTARDAFYKGLYPLAPFVLVMFFIALQLLPMFLGAVVMTAAVGHSDSLTAWEMALWSTVSFALVFWTVYMVCSSVFALYIVTLPDMRPWQSIRSARELVRGRRWMIMRKLLFLPLVLLLALAAVVLPLIFFAPVSVQYVFILLSIVGFFVSHAYIYNLYRELL